MITIHQRNQNVSNNNDTVSKTAQNSLPWVLPDKYITDQLTIQLILSLPIFLLLIPPFHKYVTVQKCNVLFSPVTNNSPMNRLSMFNSSWCPNSCVKYIPLLCRIWPNFVQKSSLCYQQSLGMIQTHVPNSQLSLMTRSELQFS